MGKLHLQHPAHGLGVPRLACRSDLATWTVTTQGQKVSCRSCRRTSFWQGRKKAATRLHEKVEHAARRGDWPRDRQRIERLMCAWPLLQAPPDVLIALDRYEEQDPADRDPAALAMELAPVDPGWLW